MMQRPLPSSFFSDWNLDPDIVFLNHGAFGACPRPVLAEQQRLRQELEAEPLRFFRESFEPLLDVSRQALAEFLGAEARDLVFVPNATTGVNAVLRSLDFSPPDEILTTDQVYNACRNALHYVSSRTGAKIVVAKLPFPVESDQDIVQTVLRQVTKNTRLALLDHVASQTALIFPLETLVAELSRLGVETLIDGAHAPGMIPVNLSQLGATYYAGNCHKWLCAPKGAGFLWVRCDRQSRIHPLTISHGANDPRGERSRLWLEFDWMGTDDPTPYLCLPQALSFMSSRLSGGWPALMAHNHQLAITAQQILCDQLRVSPPCPINLFGSMAVIPLPDDPRLGQQASYLLPPLQKQLFETFKIEVPVMVFPGPPHQWIRVSAQIYNSSAQYYYLATAMELLRS